MLQYWTTLRYSKISDEQLTNEDIPEICEKIYSQIADRFKVQLEMIAYTNKRRRF